MSRALVSVLKRKREDQAGGRGEKEGRFAEVGGLRVRDSVRVKQSEQIRHNRQRGQNGGRKIAQRHGWCVIV